jgi:hypothetical protein
MKIANAFSLSMLDPRVGAEVRFTPVSLDEARRLAEQASRYEGGTPAMRETPFGPQPYMEGATKVAESAVGHADTAALFSQQLGVRVPCCRESIRLGTDMLVGQYVGPRLPGGATSLPEGASIQWWYVYHLGQSKDCPDVYGFQSCIRE